MAPYAFEDDAKRRYPSSSAQSREISFDELEDDFFYVVDDVKFGMAGGKSRTKYKIEEIKCSKCGNIDGNIIKKIDDYQIFIR